MSEHAPEDGSPHAPDPAEGLLARLSGDLRVAMKARDRTRVRAIRTLMSAIDNAGAVTVDHPHGPEDPIVGLGAAEMPRRALDAATLAGIVEAEHRERLDAAGERRALGRPDDAVEFETEAAVIAAYRDGLGG